VPLKKSGVEEHDGDETGSGNVDDLCMCNASGHNYRNSSFIVELAMGQIPRSTECISSNTMKCVIINAITNLTK